MNALENISLVLVRPQYAGNIGSVCRAMKNMGLRKLILVSPAADHLGEEAIRMAVSARDILVETKVFYSLPEALEGFHWIAGTSARRGRNRGPFISPRELAPEILSHAQRVPVAILFGPEDKGLTNRELDPCQALIAIPAHPQLSSLNLAQAVMIICYEIYLAQISNLQWNPRAEKEFRPAQFQKVEGMYSHMEDLLLKIGFLDPKNPKRIMHTLRRIFGRAGLSERDVAIWRGIFRQMEWYVTRRKEKEA
jgi:tRNA/rRNA methyltransferase